MTINEYEQRLDALAREIADLKRENVEDEASRPKPPHPRWKPGPGNDYYFIGNAGDVYGDAISEFTGRGIDLAKDRVAIGNIFAKADEAEFAVMHLKTLAMMREWAGQYNDPWKLISDGEIVDVSPLFNNDVLSGEMRFATQYDARNCIKAVGVDRLIKYYFGVRDHEIPAETE